MLAQSKQAEPCICVALLWMCANTYMLTDVCNSSCCLTVCSPSQSPANHTGELRDTWRRNSSTVAATTSTQVILAEQLELVLCVVWCVCACLLVCLHVCIYVCVRVCVLGCAYLECTHSDSILPSSNYKLSNVSYYYVLVLLIFNDLHVYILRELPIAIE